MQRRTPKPTSGAVSGGKTLKDLSSRWIQMDCTKRKKKLQTISVNIRSFQARTLTMVLGREGMQNVD